MIQCVLTERASCWAVIRCGRQCRIKVVVGVPLDAVAARLTQSLPQPGRSFGLARQKKKKLGRKNTTARSWGHVTSRLARLVCWHGARSGRLGSRVDKFLSIRPGVKPPGRLSLHCRRGRPNGSLYSSFYIVALTFIFCIFCRI